MFINRLSGRFEQLEERGRGPDFWVLETNNERFLVTRETAQTIANCIGRIWARPWIKFHDVCGSEIMVRRRDIVHLVEATIVQRANNRLLRRMLDAEGRDGESDCE